MESLAFIWTGTRDSKTTLLFSSASDKQASIKLQRIEHKAQAKMPASSGSIRQQGQHLHLQQIQQMLIWQLPGQARSHTSVLNKSSQ